MRQIVVGTLFGIAFLSMICGWLEQDKLRSLLYMIESTIAYGFSVVLYLKDK